MAPGDLAAEPTCGELADQDRVATVAGGVKGLPGGADEAAVHHRGHGDGRALDRLRSEVLAEVWLVVDRPEVDGRQRRALPVGREVAVVALADRAHELAVVGGARLPGEEGGVAGRNARALGPARCAAAESEVERQMISRCRANDAVVRGPARGGVGIRIVAVESRLFLGVRLGRDRRPADDHPHGIRSELPELRKCRRGVDELRAVLDHRELRGVRRCRGGQRRGAPGGERRRKCRDVSGVESSRWEFAHGLDNSSRAFRVAPPRRLPGWQGPDARQRRRLANDGDRWLRFAPVVALARSG